MADVARTARAASAGAARYLPGQTAANATAPCQSVATGKRTSTGLRRQCSGLSACAVPAAIRYVTLNRHSHMIVNDRRLPRLTVNPVCVGDAPSTCLDRPQALGTLPPNPRDI